MTAERPDPGDHRVVPLRRRPPQAGNDNHRGQPAPAAIGDLTPFERAADHYDDYRHRMVVNGAAFAFCLFLVIAGVWLVTPMAPIPNHPHSLFSRRPTSPPP